MDMFSLKIKLNDCEKWNLLDVCITFISIPKVSKTYYRAKRILSQQNGKAIGYLLNLSWIILVLSVIILINSGSVYLHMHDRFVRYFPLQRLAYQIYLCAKYHFD